MANPLVSSLNTLARWFVPQPPDLQERSMEFPPLETQIDTIRRTQAAERPWRPAAVNEALGVPSILSAVSLISGVAGSLSMEGFRDGSLMADAPRLIQRPNPRSTPGAFYRDTAYYRATRGEFWWWIAKRDVDGNAAALVPVPPWEILLEPNERDRLRPTIKWGSRTMPNEDMRQSMYLPGPNGRGVGPLQLAGVAVSVAVEASHWAANFFSGNLPSLVGTTDQDLDEVDLGKLDKQWAEKQGNTPRWMTQGMKLEASPFDAVKAQLTESRSFQVGEVARMFLIPGPLLEYQMAGSSLTYRNEEDIWTDFQRRCLSPQYLEPIEQEMSDLMPRTTVGRFNLEQLLRADTKSRFEAWKFGMDAGWLTGEEVRKKEGLEPGNVDFAPVPFSPPAAELSPLPLQMRSLAPGKCSKCNKHLADAAPPGWSTTCPRCKTFNSVPLELQERADPMPTLTALAMREPRPPEVNVTIESGAISVPPTDMSGLVEILTALLNREQPQPAQITVESPPITFERGAIQVDAPDMSEVSGAIASIAERPQPDVNVTFEPAQVTVNVPEPKQTSKRIERDPDGHLIRIVEEPA